MSEPPSVSFTVTLAAEADGSVGTIPVAFDSRAVFGRARPPVAVTIAGYRYRSTVAVMGGRSFVPLRRAHREAAGVDAGDTVEVTLTLDTAPREVPLPPDLAAAIDAAGRRERWGALSYTRRRELAEAVADARKPETRTRRIGAAIAATD